MTRDDVEFLKQFIFSVSFSTIVVGLFVLFIGLLNTSEPPQDGAESPRLEVVDRYKGCEVVRYTDPSGRYTYLLDCLTTPGDRQ